MQGHLLLEAVDLPLKKLIKRTLFACAYDCISHSLVVWDNALIIFLTLGAHAQRGLVLGPAFAAKKRYQRVQCHTGLILLKWRFS